MDQRQHQGTWKSCCRASAIWTQTDWWAGYQGVTAVFEGCWFWPWPGKVKTCLTSRKSSIKPPSQISPPPLFRGRKLLSPPPPLSFKPPLSPPLPVFVDNQFNNKWETVFTWTDPVWFIHMLEVQICFWSLAAWPPTSCACALPLCVLVLYGELIPSSGCLKKQYSTPEPQVCPWETLLPSVQATTFTR